LNLKTYQWIKLIAEQKVKEGKEDELNDEEIKTITVDKWTPSKEPGFDEYDVKVQTTDYGTFKELYEKYGNSFRYFCAQFPVNHHREFPLFPDPDKAEAYLRANPEKVFGKHSWMLMNMNRTPEEVEAMIQSKLKGSDPHLCPLIRYGNNTAWIDLTHNVILVEHAK
jgi:hypothetical protein